MHSTFTSALTMLIVVSIVAPLAADALQAGALYQVALVCIGGEPEDLECPVRTIP